MSVLCNSLLLTWDCRFPSLNCPPAIAFSAEFDDYVDNKHPAVRLNCFPFLSLLLTHPIAQRVLLDHIFVSKSLVGRSTSMVAHDVFQKAMRNGGRQRQDRPSDHRPLIADFRTGE